MDKQEQIAFIIETIICLSLLALPFIGIVALYCLV